jgi:hypothetical protein
LSGIWNLLPEVLYDRFAPGVDLELFIDVADMGFDSFHVNEQFACNFLIKQAFGQA